MTVTRTDVIVPSGACHRLGHRIHTRNKQTTSGKYDVCVVCTVGYQMALERGMTTDQADEFVKELRCGP